MRYNAGYNREGDYEHLVVNESMPLLEWLLANVQQSRSKIKATLQGRGIKVNGKTVSQFDFQLEPGMKVAISKTKRNQEVIYKIRCRIIFYNTPNIFFNFLTIHDHTPFSLIIA